MRKLTPRQVPLYQEYKKEYNRLTRAIKELTEQGYQVDYELEKPSEKKSFTRRQIEKLQKVTRERLRESSTKVDYETGEYEEAKSKRKIGGLKRVKQKSGNLFEPMEDEVAGDYDVSGTREVSYMSVNKLNVLRMREDLSRFPNGKGARWLLSWLDSAVTMFDTEEIGYEVVGQAAKELYYGEFTINFKKIVSSEEAAGVFANSMLDHMREFMESNPQYTSNINKEKYEKFNWYYTKEAKEKFDELISETEEV